VDTAAISWTVPNAGVSGAATGVMAGAATVLPAPDFDLLPGNGSTPSGRFEVFLLAADDRGEEAEDDGSLPECRGGVG